MSGVVRRRRRRLCVGFALLALLALGTTLWMFLNARAMPIVRRMDIALAFHADAPKTPVTIALLTDTHLSGPDNGPERLGRIVDQVNGLHPDLILLGGDYDGDWKGAETYDIDDSARLFARLHAPMGVVSVLGNHDVGFRRVGVRKRWRALMQAMGGRLLLNEAVRRGPLVIGGIEHTSSARTDLPKVVDAMQALGGVPILLSHQPDIFPQVPDTVPLTLVGHTHCGQVALPFWGAIYVPSRFGTLYACGLFRVGQKTMVVSAGVGTSGLPLRAFAPPDIWLITVRPQ